MYDDYSNNSDVDGYEKGYGFKLFEFSFVPFLTSALFNGPPFRSPYLMRCSSWYKNSVPKALADCITFNIVFLSQPFTEIVVEVETLSLKETN